MSKTAVNHVIETFGGVARMCERMSSSGWDLNPGSVYKWRWSCRIPELWGARMIITSEALGLPLDRAVLMEAMQSKVPAFDPEQVGSRNHAA